MRYDLFRELLVGQLFSIKRDRTVPLETQKKMGISITAERYQRFNKRLLRVPTHGLQLNAATFQLSVQLHSCKESLAPIRNAINLHMLNCLDFQTRLRKSGSKWFMDFSI